jgi:superfamily I DNA and RNA helicase
MTPSGETLEITVNKQSLEADPAAKALLKHLENSQKQLGLMEASVYHRFPIYRDEEGALIAAPLLIVSPSHGALVLMGANASERSADELPAKVTELDQVFSAIYSRLLRNKNLRRSNKELSFSAEAALFAPFLSGPPPELDTTVLTSTHALDEYLNNLRLETALSEEVSRDILSTIEGAKGLIRPSKRTVGDQPNSKGALVARLETEIQSFDLQQKNAYAMEVTGPERIRGLAGSGKTVILCMKAALAHLREPDARICYTFYTKSLYQHVQRLITRFYRQFDDRDPDWSKLKIMHGWGGFNNEGVYFHSAHQHGIAPLSFAQARSGGQGHEFDYVCKHLLKNATLRPLFDYMFIDEGQDFPASFLQMCGAITAGQKFVWAYDDLQTIFRVRGPTAGEAFGVNAQGKAKIEFTRDTVLYKCYRNPREILVSAHALGLGVYSSTKPVQMLETREQWKDIGYKITAGDLTPGSVVEIERPAENSPSSISTAQPVDEIVSGKGFDSLEDEVEAVAKSVKSDLESGLRPDDILIVTVDDRHAKDYLRALEHSLYRHKIEANNIHVDSYGLVDFSMDQRVTLSTVHKAKGNEAFMVYVMGVDSCFVYPDVQQRNKLFTAMTRAKAWVRLSGVGSNAERCLSELGLAKENFPSLRFKYPTDDGLKVMKDDLQLGAAKGRNLERLFAELEAEIPEGEDVEELVRRMREARAKISSSKVATKPKPRGR